jgi:hypothetical protein
LYINSAGTAGASGDFRAPIFYDSNNTARYVDPNSTTLLEECRASVFYDVYDTNYYIQGRSISYLNDLRPNIIYDRNDTARYIDPNGTSVLQQVQAHDWFRSHGEAGLYSQSYGQHFYPDSGGFYWDVDGPIRIRDGYEGTIHCYLGYHDGSGAGILNSSGNWAMRMASGNVEFFNITYMNDTRSTIYYDSNDTGYYCNPNGYSSMHSMRLWGNELYIRGGSPTLFFTDTDQMSAMLHNNSNLFYILRGAADSTGWATVGSGWWPMTLNLTNNDVSWGGNITAAYNVIAYASDRRLKENIKEIPNAIEKIKAIRGVTFDWNDISEENGFIPERKYDDIGCIAQEVQAILPHVVTLAPFDRWKPDPGKDYTDEELDEKMDTSRSGENYLTIQYERMVPLLVQAIKEQQVEIEDLKSLVKQLLNK